MSAERTNWLLFIDTNILLDFYRLPGESAARQLQALERHKESLILGEQVRMEFLKNRQAAILAGIKAMTAPTKPSMAAVLTDYKPAKMLLKQHDNAEKQFAKVKKRIEAILENPSANDPVYQSLNRIFDHPHSFNLMRPDKRRFSIQALARKRFVLGNPPRKMNDTSIGDAINWEWIIRCAETSAKNHNILVVSRDGDFGSYYRDKSILNDWLRREFRERVSQKRKIELTRKLTDGLKRLREPVNPSDIEEEKKLMEETSRLGNVFAQAFQSQPMVQPQLLSWDDLLAKVLEGGKEQSGRDK